MSDVNVTKILLSKGLVEQIKSEIRDSIKASNFQSEPDVNTIKPDELEFAELNILIPLIGNRIISAIDEGANVVSCDKVFNNPEVSLIPQSLIPITYFIGDGSCYQLSRIGNASTHILCRP